ncbi:hypothetical protein IG631_14253 [Alternaria alternata]|nr:hypothetical protein IG631_14253 [Alternaria alternata]
MCSRRKRLHNASAPYQPSKRSSMRCHIAPSSALLSKPTCTAEETPLVCRVESAVVLESEYRSDLCSNDLAASCLLVQSLIGSCIYPARARF